MMRDVLLSSHISKNVLFLIISSILLTISLSNLAQAQLSREDIENLRQQIKEEGWTFTVGETPATSRSMDELCGLVFPDNWREKAKFVSFADKADLPEKFDWRESGLPPVKDQGNCGSCWAFATVATLECNIKISDNVTVDLSEQYLVSCNSDYWGCGGGLFAFDYFQWKPDPCGDSGAILEQYFPYTASNQPCQCPYPHSYFIEDWAYIDSPNDWPADNAIKQAIMHYGPVTVGAAATADWSAYTGGIFNECSSNFLNHAVVLVGWDDTQGDHGVWIMRNSWGEEWGEDGGYMRIPYGCSGIGYGAAFIVYRPLAPDVDEDGIANEEDNCMWTPNSDQSDLDNDGYGDVCDICPTSPDNDQDFDGLCGPEDNCPYINNPDQGDMDGDGVGDVCDICPENYDPGQEDIDQDGIGDACDNCVQTFNPYQHDIDFDGIGNECDADVDGDGILNDGDGSGIEGDNPCQTGQNINCDDNCPLVYNPDQLDSDGNGTGDFCEVEYKNLIQWPVSLGGNDHWYGILADTFIWSEAGEQIANPAGPTTCGYLATITSQEENDFIFDNLVNGLRPGTKFQQFWLGGEYSLGLWRWQTGEPFTYGNWAPGEPYNVPVETIVTMWGDSAGAGLIAERPPATWNNTQKDQYGYWSIVEWNSFGLDPDSDCVAAQIDNCPDTYNPDQADKDSDGQGDACDLDADNDGRENDVDNCPLVYNPDQDNDDGDSYGTVCDNCPDYFNDDQADLDNDGLGDVCDPDYDGDRIYEDGDHSGIDGDNPCRSGNLTDCDDNCPGIANHSQADVDGDGIGDACDFDNDGDNVPDSTDNCPAVYNPDQEDSNGDGHGDSCCCFGITGDINCDSGTQPDISDITRLIDYLYLTNSPLCCPVAADVNGDCGEEPDVSDIVRLIDYLYLPTHTPPVSCGVCE